MKTIRMMFQEKLNPQQEGAILQSEGSSQRRRGPQRQGHHRQTAPPHRVQVQTGTAEQPSRAPPSSPGVTSSCHLCDTLPQSVS